MNKYINKTFPHKEIYCDAKNLYSTCVKDMLFVKIYYEQRL